MFEDPVCILKAIRVKCSKIIQNIHVIFKTVIATQERTNIQAAVRLEAIRGLLHVRAHAFPLRSLRSKSTVPHSHFRQYTDHPNG